MNIMNTFRVNSTGQIRRVTEVAYYDCDDNLLFSADPNALELYANFQRSRDEYEADGAQSDLIEYLGCSHIDLELSLTEDA